MKAVSSAVVQAKLLDLRGQNNIGSLDLSMCRRSTSVCCIKCTFHSSDNGLQETDKSLELPSFSCLSSDVSKAKFAKQTHISVKKHNQSRRTNYSAEASTYDGKVLSTASSAARERFGVLLLNLGGPETLNDVQPFLFNLFADPDILRLPRLFQFLQRPLAQLISVFRAPKGEGYAAIGGGSPLRRITDDQIKEDKITKLVVLPLYPQFSISTSGSSIRVLQSIIREDFTRLPISIIESWYQREGYINSMADLIENELLIFSKPEESQVGPVQWLKPYTDEIIVELGRRGTRSLLVVPVGFVSEHIETLEEIDMEYRHLALQSGIENWDRVPALGCTSSFISDLADAVIEALPCASISNTRSAPSQCETATEPVPNVINLFFGSIFAFVLLLSPRLISAFRNFLF